jgi:hypothetical protein
LLVVSALIVGLWDLIRLVRAVVREKGNLGMFQFHHNPHPKTSLLPSQSSCSNRERNQVRNQVRRLVKSLNPSLSADQSVSIVSIVERMVTRKSFAIKEGERRQWLRSGQTRTGTTLFMSARASYVSAQGKGFCVYSSSLER